MTNIAIIGCNGRMGKALIKAVWEHDHARLAGGTVRKGSPHQGKDLGAIALIDTQGITASDDIRATISQASVVIDFTQPALSLEAAAICADHQIAYVCGTTGFSEQEHKQLHRFAERIPLLWSANMSVGVNLIAGLVEQVARICDSAYDIEIVEMHHRNKVDAPSGTALLLGNAAAKGRNVALNDVACRSRDGIIGARKTGEIGFATLRGGDVIGDHNVIFAGDGERIEIGHKATDRSVFAKGAVRAAIWLTQQQPGYYHMNDMLFG